MWRTASGQHGSAGHYRPHLPTSDGPTRVKGIHVRRVLAPPDAGLARMALPRSLPALPPARSRSTWSARSEARTYDVDGRRVAAIVGDEVGPDPIHDQPLQDRQLGPKLTRRWGQNSPAKPAAGAVRETSCFAGCGVRTRGAERERQARPDDVGPPPSASRVRFDSTRGQARDLSRPPYGLPLGTARITCPRPATWALAYSRPRGTARKTR